MSDIPILDILLFKHFFNFSQSYLDLFEIFVETNLTDTYFFIMVQFQIQGTKQSPKLHGNRIFSKY